jgi:tRNA (uracil-5-)-methyltransferase TRM9
MEESVIRRLGELNQEFYRRFASAFAGTRRGSQPGFYQLETYLPDPCSRLLDVGCGEGRLGRFLLATGRVQIYHGLDGSQALLDIAGAQIDGEFWRRDLLQGQALAGLGNYDAIACLAVLQHIPGRDNRLRLVAGMGQHLTPGGRLLVSNWQFLGSERQRKKIVDWEQAGLSPELVEGNDYLLTWQRGGRGLRYVSYIDEAEMATLARQAGLRTVATFRADGREGDLNLYSVHEPV